MVIVVIKHDFPRVFLWFLHVSQHFRYRNRGPHCINRHLPRPRHQVSVTAATHLPAVRSGPSGPGHGRVGPVGPHGHPRTDGHHDAMAVGFIGTIWYHYVYRRIHHLVKYIYIYLFIYTFTYLYIYIHFYIYIYFYIYTYIYIYMYMYTVTMV